MFWNEFETKEEKGKVIKEVEKTIEPPREGTERECRKIERREGGRGEGSERKRDVPDSENLSPKRI